MTGPVPPPDPPIQPYTPPPVYPPAPGYPPAYPQGQSYPHGQSYPQDQSYSPAQGYQTQGYQAQGYPGYQPAQGYPPPTEAYPAAPYQQPYGYSPYPATRPVEGLAIASLVVSCVAALAICAYGLGGLIGPVGAVLGHVARRRIRVNGTGGEGMALAGIIVGWVATGLGLLAIAGVVALIATDGFGAGT
jgi:hypothetical protein